MYSKSSNRQFRSTANRLVERRLDALTSCCRSNNRSLERVGGVCADMGDHDTGAGDKDASDESEDAMPLTHHGHTNCWPQCKKRGLWRLRQDRHVQIREG